MDHSFVKSELTLFSYEVMGLVGRDGAGPHDLLRMARRGRMLDWAGESQYYVEPKRLTPRLPGGAHGARADAAADASTPSPSRGSDAAAAWAGPRSRSRR